LIVSKQFSDVTSTDKAGMQVHIDHSDNLPQTGSYNSWRMNKKPRHVLRSGQSKALPLHAKEAWRAGRSINRPILATRGCITSRDNMKVRLNMGNVCMRQH